MGTYTVFYECKFCSSRTFSEDHEISKTIPDLECGKCGKSVSWNRLVINRQEKKESNMPSFIPVMHSWFDPGANRSFSGRKEAEQYAKEKGKAWVSDKEIDQEVAHNQKRNEKERYDKDFKNTVESVNRVLHKHGIRKY